MSDEWKKTVALVTLLLGGLGFIAYMVSLQL